MAKKEKDGLKAENEPGVEWKQAVAVTPGQNWRRHFYHDTLPPGWQGAMVAAAAEGLSENETMVSMRVTESCWLRWKENSKEFQELLTLCNNIAQAWFEKTARENINNPYFKDKLWAMIVTARFGDPLQLKSSGPSFHERIKDAAAPVPLVDDARLEHLFNGGDGMYDEKKPEKKKKTS